MASSCGEDASKNALRDAYLTLRAGLTPRQRGRLEAQVVRHLTELEAYRSADLLLAYVAYRDEMDTRAMCERAWADGKSVALPRCEGGERSLAFYVVNTLEGLAPGARGALEPVVDDGDVSLDPTALQTSVCLVPGLVFDAAGYRVGYGAGYYDNFLVGYVGTKVGVVHAMQVSGNPLPHDEHDVAVDVLVSDGAIWMCR